MNKLKLYLQESYEELSQRVTWPTWEDLLKTAGLVLIASMLLAILIFGVDSVIGLILQKVFYR